MKVREDTVNGRTVLYVQGRIDTSTADAFQTLIQPTLDRVSDDLVFEFSGLEYISSAGLRVMLRIARQLAANQGRAVLCGMNAETKDIFDVSGFTQLFNIAESVESAPPPR